jgi:glycosyltransferase domain-containing protein
MLRDVALMIPTRNRPHFVHRLLSYHAKSRDLQIIFADGSDPERMIENQAIIKSFANGSLELIHHTLSSSSAAKDELAGLCGYFDRVVNGARLSLRRFIHISADDDFVSPEFLAEAASFLDGHPDYIAVTGYVFAVRLDRPGAEGVVAERTFGTLRPTPRVEPHAVDRIARYASMRVTELASACLRRTAFDTISQWWIEAVNRAREPANNTQPKITTFTLLYVYGLIVDYLALTLGKVHWLPRVQMARQVHESNLGAKIRFEYDANLADSFLATHWPALVAVYLDAVTETLMDREGLGREIARRIAEGGLALRAGARLVHEGTERLARSGADMASMPPSGSDGIRDAIRSIPGAGTLGRAVLRRIRKWRSSSPKLARLPDDVATILEFLDSYRRLPVTPMSGVAGQARLGCPSR